MFFCAKSLATAAVLLLLSGCQFSLEKVDPSRPNTSNFYTSEGNIAVAVNGTYAAMTLTGAYSINYWLIGDGLSDDTGPGDDQDFVASEGAAVDNFRMNANAGPAAGLWAAMYTGVSRANTILTRVPGAPIGEAAKSRFLGEASFLRALFYFNLVRLYGDVPLFAKEITSQAELQTTRSPASAVYAQIIADLTFAEQNLPGAYSGEDAGRATQGAASALLAKVYLTLGETDGNYYQLARDKAYALMQTGTYRLHPQYTDLFKPASENGPESIFEIQFKGGPGGYFDNRQGTGSVFNDFFSPRFKGTGAGSEYAWAGWGFNIPTSDASAQRDGFTPGTGIVEAYAPNDLRRDVAVLDYYADQQAKGKQPDLNISRYYVNKYRDFSDAINIHNSNNNYYLLRYADVLLMFAEAENEVAGPTDAAYDAVNLVRRRAGLPDLPPGLSKAGFLDALYLERRLELAFEAHRWFDLIRRPDRAVQVLKAHGKTAVTPDRLLLPIPQTAIDDSYGLMEQNAAYR